MHLFGFFWKPLKKCELTRADATEEESSAQKRLQGGRRMGDGRPGLMSDTWNTKSLDPLPQPFTSSPTTWPHQLPPPWETEPSLRKDNIWVPPVERAACYPVITLHGSPQVACRPKYTGLLTHFQYLTLMTKVQLRMARLLRKSPNTSKRHPNQQVEPERNRQGKEPMETSKYTIK